MERKLASIQIIKDLQPIAGADKIEVATVLGWHCVVKKGEFKIGDPCIYFEVDSVLPERPEFEFMRARHFRVKTIKLRGQVSQGLALPLTIQGGLIDAALFDTLVIGADVSELLNVKKYEPYVPAQLAGQIRGNFPGFLQKTDETRIQAVPDVLARHHNKFFYITEKLDGSSMTMYLCNERFGVCSRNLDLEETEDNTFWKTARAGEWKEKLKVIASMLGVANVSVQGELVGQGIQKNKYKLGTPEIYLFNIFDIDNYKYIGFADFKRITEQLGLQTVPVVNENFHLFDARIDELVEMSNGKSVLNPDVNREGLVFRTMTEETDPELGRLSFKVISPQFLLLNDE